MHRILNYCRAGGWLLSSAVAALAAASCNGEDDVSQLTAYNQPHEPAEAGAVVPGAGRCVPGQTLTCLGVCQGFGLGYQVCAADGLSYGECICPAVAPIASVGGDGVIVIPPRFDPGSQVPVGVPGPGAGRIGASCARDADCGGTLNCFEAGTDSFAFGGPAGGYCTTGCDTSAACTAIDRASTCGSLGGRQLCIHTCRSQAPEEGAEKCLGRPDLSCLSAAALGDEEPADEPQFGICAPRCQSDAGCGGRRCDLFTGLCSDEPRAGDPIGAACDAPETCAAGLCLGATAESTGFCSAFCTVGVDGCGYDGSEPTIGAACLLPQIPSEGAGDRGLCFELCDVAEDCTEPGFTCVAEPTRGRAGACLPEQLPSEGPDEPGEPGSDEGLGLECEADDDCGAGLSCLSSDADPFGVGGGPARGYCSAPCDFAEDCPSGAVCTTTPGGGYCLKACDEDAADACGRETALCVSLGAGGACLPNCTSDDECGDRACDLEFGLCVESAEPQCETDDDCSEGICDVLLGRCVPEPGSEPECETDDDCIEGVCDVEFGTCVPEPGSEPECETDDDCIEGVCDVDLGACVEEPEPEAECETDDDCIEGVCDVDLGACVEEPEPEAECETDDDCPEGVCDLPAGTCTLQPSGCLLDEDCGDRVCNVIDGICIDAPPVAIGASCSEDVECTGEAAGEDDSRLCLGLGGDNFCSAVCLWGTPLGCEAYGTDAFCILPIDDRLGVCLELCNVPEDCQQSGYDCVSIGTDINDWTGACLPPQAAAGTSSLSASMPLSR
jgi:hypothetical protein